MKIRYCNLRNSLLAKAFLKWYAIRAHIWQFNLYYKFADIYETIVPFCYWLNFCVKYHHHNPLWKVEHGKVKLYGNALLITQPSSRFSKDKVCHYTLHFARQSHIENPSKTTVLLLSFLCVIEIIFCILVTISPHRFSVKCQLQGSYNKLESRFELLS